MSHRPFWQPWNWGYLWRAVAGVAGIVAFMLALMLLLSVPRCGSGESAGTSDSDSLADNQVQTPDPGVIDPDCPLKPLDPEVPDNTVDPVRNVPEIPQNPFVPQNPVYDPGRGSEIDPDHIFVVIDPDKSTATPLQQSFENEVRTAYPGSNVVLFSTETWTAIVQVPADQIEQIVEDMPPHMAQKGIVLYADIISIFQGDDTPSDEAMKSEETSWHITSTKAPQAWDITKGNPQVKVAIIDSYFDLTHPEFAGLNIQDAASFENGTSDVSPKGPVDDSYCHGTHVMGIIAAQHNGMGTVGIAPNVTVIPISLGRNMNSANIVQAVLYALNKGANVINLSLGLCLPQEVADQMTADEQLEYWVKANKRLNSLWDYIYNMVDDKYCTIVWAAGNNNLFEAMDETKRNDKTIKVEAANQKLDKAFFSNFGNIDGKVDGKHYSVRQSMVAAPGVDIASTVPGRQYGMMSGTSQAAPIVSGAVALMKSVDPSLTNRQIIDIIERTGLPMANDSVNRFLQIYPALKAIKATAGTWDDFKANPVGLWKRAEQTSYHEVPSGRFTFNAHDYLEFRDRNNGVIEVHVLGQNTVVNARFTATWGDDECVLNIVGDFVDASGGNPIVHTQLRLYRDAVGDVSCKVTKPEEAKDTKIRRLTTDDRRNTNKRRL